MHSDSNPIRNLSGHALAGMALVLAGMTVLAGPVRAEDPLLGRIKLIKCVGCDPGSVNLIINDPIEVRDFEVQIKEEDYQKIITPLAGKTVYDKEGCFYWMDVPKDAKPSVKDGAVKDGAKDPAKEAPGKEGTKDGKKAGAKKGGKKDVSSDSSTKDKDGLMETSAPPPTPVTEGKPSRCIPYVRIEVKPTHPNGKKEEE